jgi:hypothetical protein
LGEGEGEEERGRLLEKKTKKIKSEKERDGE